MANDVYKGVDLNFRDDLIRRALPHDVFTILHDLAYHHDGRDVLDYVRRAQEALRKESPSVNNDGLLPCPFCGGEPKIQNLGSDDDFYVSCTKCEFQQIADYTKEVAMKRWNTRPHNEDCPYAKRLTFGSGKPGTTLTEDLIHEVMTARVEDIGVEAFYGKATPRQELEDGKPCSHAGCLSHMSHPCEGCHRFAGRNFNEDLILRSGLPHDVFGILHDLAYHHDGRNVWDYVRRARETLRKEFKPRELEQVWKWISEHYEVVDFRVFPKGVNKSDSENAVALHDVLRAYEAEFSRAEENERLRSKVRDLNRDLQGVRENRDHFCHFINEIARLFWGDDKQCYAPDATLRKVIALRDAAQKVIDAYNGPNDMLDEITALAAAAEIKMPTCRHCRQPIEKQDGIWVSPTSGGATAYCSVNNLHEPEEAQ